MQNCQKCKPYRPNRLLVRTVLACMRRPLTACTEFTFDRSALAGVEPPYIVLFNHVGDEDHYFVGLTLLPELANYMVSRWVQHSFPAGPLSARAGAIHKNRFIPDVDAVLACKRVLTQRKGVIAVAPAASYSIDGTPNFFDYGIAKLVKLFKAPVFALRMDGLFLFENRYMADRQRCRVQATVTRVFDGPELGAMDAPEIYQKLYESCDFNDYAYQRRTLCKVTREKKGLAEGLENATFRCLRCGREYTIRAEDDRLVCGACGNTVRVNDRYLLEPTEDDTAWVDGLDRWNAIQKKAVEREVMEADFRLSFHAAILHYTKGKRYGFSEYGEGTLTLDRAGLTYEGSDMGTIVEYRYPLEKTPYLGSDSVARYVSVDSTDDVYRFRLDNSQYVTKLLLALRTLRFLYCPNFPGEYDWYRALPTVHVDDTVQIGRT